MASINEVPCGFAATYFTVSGLIAQRLAHLGDLYVVPEFRKRGVGTALFEAVSGEAYARGIGLVRWLSISANDEVNAWYRKIAKPIGTFELYLRPTEANSGRSASQPPTPDAV
jgi:GNAT superfamily N-acetyltransferase